MKGICYAHGVVEVRAEAGTVGLRQARLARRYRAPIPRPRLAWKLCAVSPRKQTRQPQVAAQDFICRG